jgi:nicastrin
MWANLYIGKTVAVYMTLFATLLTLQWHATSPNSALVSAEYDGDSFRGSIAKEIAQAACYRLFTNDGDIGCRSPSSDGATGALFEVHSDSDIDAASNMDLDLVIALSAQYFTAENLAKLQGFSRTKGILILEESSSDTAADNSFISSDKYSTEVPTPQGDGTYQSQYTINPSAAWNANYGNGIAYQSLNIPVVRVDRYESATVRSYCADNRKYGYHSNRVGYANMRFYMGKSGITSKQCLEWTDIYDDRSPQCIPLGGQSVWGTTGVIDARPKVVGTIGFDSTGHFHDIAWGANDAAASVAAFLGAVEAIGRLDHAAFSKQIVFFAANAEEWGYVGSRQFVKDIQGFYCANWVNDTDIAKSGMPLCADPVYPNAMFTELLPSFSKDFPLTAIQAVVALDQIGIQQAGADTPSFYLHSTSGAMSETVGSILSVAGSMPDTKVSVSSSVNVPPTPAMTFEREFDGLSGEAVVISAYDQAYLDPAHHTQYDVSQNLNMNSVLSAAELFAKSLVNLAGGDPSLVSINETWVRSALTCLTDDWKCEFMSGYVSYEEVIDDNSYFIHIYVITQIMCYNLYVCAEKLGGDAGLRRVLGRWRIVSVCGPDSGQQALLLHGCDVLVRLEATSRAAQALPLRKVRGYVHIYAIDIIVTCAICLYVLIFIPCIHQVYGCLDRG